MLLMDLRSNKTSFKLYKVIQNSYSKNNFNPSDVSTLNPTTGLFTIIDHFFETGERLIYRFYFYWNFIVTGIATAGGTLGSEVYAIRINKDTFKISKSRPDALSEQMLHLLELEQVTAHNLKCLRRMKKH